MHPLAIPFYPTIPYIGIHHWLLVERELSISKLTKLSVTEFSFSNSVLNFLPSMLPRIFLMLLSDYFQQFRLLYEIPCTARFLSKFSRLERDWDFFQTTERIFRFLPPFQGSYSNSSFKDFSLPCSEKNAVSLSPLSSNHQAASQLSVTRLLLRESSVLSSILWSWEKYFANLTSIIALHKLASWKSKFA